MSHTGVDLTANGGSASTGISWHEPHPIFVVILVGSEEIPFGIQKDLLCAQSLHYRHKFAQNQEERIEHVMKLPNGDAVTFGYVQNFMFTGGLYDKPSGNTIPDYNILMGVWKLATYLDMPPLRIAVLDAMAERRQMTGFIPSVSILVEAWRSTEEGCGLRKMLVGWAAEHMRSNADDRTEFARTLPQEILSALVLALSEMPALPATPLAAPADQRSIANQPRSFSQDENFQPRPEPRPVKKRVRKSAIDLVDFNDDEDFDVKPNVKKPARKSEPVHRVNRPVEPLDTFDSRKLTPVKDLEYCRDLIKRMISGPGYWTRYVPNFKKAIDPVADNAPSYFDVVKKPMCLNTMNDKMNKGEYTSAAEFESDIRLIFQNCYEYWTPMDPIWKECEIFEKFFDAQWNGRHSYRGHGPKKIKAEAIE